jgi:hypothetical protein
MAFNYQSLKKITNAAIVDGTIVEADLGTTAVSAAKIATGQVTAAKLAPSSVDLSGAKVTGTATVAQGGLGLSSTGGAYRVVRSDGSNLTTDNHGVASIQVWTGNGTWSRPSGVRYIKVQIQGGGGGGSGHGEGGAAGGYAERFLDVTGISSVSINIGGGGGGNYYSGAGGNGGTSSFGPYLSGQGGHGANRQNQHSGGVSGRGNGGQLNIHQGGGFSHHAYSAQSCANSFFGGGAPGNHPQGGHFAHNHQNHTAQGTGGAGAHFHGHRGSDGRPGMVVVTNYY